jgi:uncharacterized protein YndB with AHSA1/START domain
MKTIHHVIDMEVPAGTVWSALTNERGLAGWWTTNVRGEAASVGGRIDFRFGGDFNPVMEVVSLEPTELVEWRCVGGHDRRR